MTNVTQQMYAYRTLFRVRGHAPLHSFFYPDAHKVTLMTGALAAIVNHNDCKLLPPFCHCGKQIISHSFSNSIPVTTLNIILFLLPGQPRCTEFE